MDYQYEFVAEKKIDSVLLNLKRYGITIVPNYLGRGKSPPRGGNGASRHPPLG